MNHLKKIAVVGVAASTLIATLISKSGGVGDMFSQYDSNENLEAYINILGGDDIGISPVANIAEDAIDFQEYSGEVKEFLKMAYDTFRHPFSDSHKINDSKKQNETANQTIARNQSNQKDETPEAYINSVSLKGYENQIKQTEPSVIPAIIEENVNQREEGYNPHADPRLKDAKFKKLYVFVTPQISEERGGLENIQNEVKILPIYMNFYLKRFDAGVAIDEVIVAGIANFESRDTRKIVFDELNTKYGCKYLRNNNIQARDALFLGIIDEKTWGTLYSDLTDNINKATGVGYENGGGLIRFPSGTSFTVKDKLIVHEVIGHGWGLEDRKDVSFDIMDNSAEFSEGEPNTFVDAWKIKLNADGKVNTC